MFLHSIIDRHISVIEVIALVCSLGDLRNKEVINIKNGAKLGFVDDVEINMKEATVLALIVYGRPRLFGLFGREEDLIIKCDEIELIGEDTILVSYDDLSYHTKTKSFSFESLLK